MKKLILSTLMFLAIATPVSALNIPWEQYRPSTGFPTTYDIALIDDVINVRLDLRLIGTVASSLLTQWETGVESIWSTNRFATPIVVDLNWTNTNYDRTIYVANGSGRTTTSTWYTTLAGWGNDYQDEVAAHEAGHYLGCWDEYSGAGWALGPSPKYTNGLMGTLTGGTFDYYYNGILSWLDGPHSKYVAPTVLSVNEPTINVHPIPEPATIILLGIGLLGLSIIRKTLK